MLDHPQFPTGWRRPAANETINQDEGINQDGVSY
jgi:hypothetical protein